MALAASSNLFSSFGDRARPMSFRSRSILTPPSSGCQHLFALSTCRSTPTSILRETQNLVACKGRVGSTITLKERVEAYVKKTPFCSRPGVEQTPVQLYAKRADRFIGGYWGTSFLSGAPGSEDRSVGNRAGDPDGANTGNCGSDTPCPAI